MKPFEKDKYLKNTKIQISEKEIVTPIEGDIEVCIQYLKENGRLICDYNVREAVRKYLKGEINIDFSNNSDFHNDNNLQHATLNVQSQIPLKEIETDEIVENQNIQFNEPQDKKVKKLEEYSVEELEKMDSELDNDVAEIEKQNEELIKRINLQKEIQEKMKKKQMLIDRYNELQKSIKE